MTYSNPSLTRVADKDLAKEASWGGIFFLITWLFIVYTTSVAGDLPIISFIGIGLFVLLVTSRLILGLGFDKLYKSMTPRHWRRSFGLIILVNGLTWGSLNAILIWHYFPSWPASLSLICTAILAAGGTITLNTHLRILRGFHVLAIMPGIIILIIIRSENSSEFGVLVLIYTLFLMAFSRQLNTRYWNALQNSHQLKDTLQKAEEANQAKSQFLANMSHEIRTPLNAMLGLAQIGTRSSQDSDTRSRFSHILASGQHLLSIINEILDLSKLDSGKLRVESFPFELVANVNEALEFVREPADAKGLSLSVEFDPKLPEWVRGDPQRLRQILVNLLDNAVKFTQKGGVRLVVHPVNDQICFSVIDTGIGIEHANIPRLFTAFEQADGSTTRRFGGTGLGLSISLNLAQLMGGSITAQSVSGQGSTFTLYLPLLQTLPSEDHVAREPKPADGRLLGLSVLAVEDDELNRIVLCEMLNYEGVNVTLAENGQQALDYLTGSGPGTFDMVLMDIQMPLMDGYEATRHIHTIAPELPVIGLTAHAMEEERERCLTAGMVAHISKPVDADHLMTALLQQLPTRNEQDIIETPEAELMEPPLLTESTRHDSLPGIDIDGAMKNLKCDFESFKKILLTFYRQRRNNYEEISTSLASGNINRAGDLAHGIKGSSGYLGARKLYREALAMEEACMAGELDVAMDRLSPFRLSFEEVMNGLDRLSESGENHHSEEL